MSKETIVAEYEELIKIKEFHMKEERDPLMWTYQKVLKDLEREYVNNIADKIDRWITVTNARYFKQSPGVLYYFQAKMLYRDGYYEAAIAMSRSICEMICYDFLSKEVHPFGTEKELEQTLFGPLLRFLAIPKNIEKAAFTTGIIGKITSQEDQNFFKSSYRLEGRQYVFKTENGKENKNLKRMHEILDKVGYPEKGIFKADTYTVIQSVYDLGSSYIHARKSNNPTNEDAIICLNSIGKVLAYLYTVDELMHTSIVTGYNAFPDVCKGTSFWIDTYFSPEAAMRGYVNAPSPAQVNQLLSLTGTWQGSWRVGAGDHTTGILRFVTDGEYFKASLSIDKHKNSYEQIVIRLFGEYFHLIIYETLPDGTSGKDILKFELEIFDNTTLMGKIFKEEGKAVFMKI